jgi:hypothetical protein
MHMRTFIAVLVIAILAIVAWRLFFVGPNVNDFATCREAGGQVMESYPARCVWDGVTYTQVVEGTDHEMVDVTFPDTNSLVTSPIQVTGYARGGWFFEASFPVKVTDLDGNVLGQGVAQAKGDWMTDDFVPFTASVTYDRGSAQKGYVVLEKDNPSGLPEHDDSLKIPVTFAN